MINKGKRKTSFRTIRHRVEYKRNYFKCTNCNEKSYPLDKILSVEELRDFPPRLNIIISRLDADYTYNKVVDIVSETDAEKIN